MVTTLKNRFKAKSLQFLGLNFLHITGCARSGTTLLFYVMSAFKKMNLHDHETNIWSHPNREEIKEVKKKSEWPHVIYVTKRPSKWYQEPWLSRTIDFVKNSNSRLIYIMRDPRAVLTSRHPLDKKQYYVSPEKWVASMQGYFTIKKELNNHPRFLVIKYEDLIQKHEQVVEKFKTVLGMELNDNIQSIANLKTNIQNSELKNQYMIQFMHNLRDFDPASIDRWKNNSQNLKYLEKLLNETRINSELQNIMNEFDYH